MRIQSRIQAHINLDAIDYNLKNMHDYMGEDTQIIAVLKADGYGHGAGPIAKEIQDYPYRITNLDYFYQTHNADTDQQVHLKWLSADH